MPMGKPSATYPTDVNASIQLSTFPMVKFHDYQKTFPGTILQLFWVYRYINNYKHDLR